MSGAAPLAQNETLARLGLLRAAAPPDPLRTLCHHELLVGGVSIALDVKLDEALGPVLEAMGGDAPTLRVLDIRGKPPVFSVKLGEVAHEWEIEGLEALIDTLNRAFKDHPQVKALVSLGEWEEMTQVWAVPKQRVRELLRCEWFKPPNRAALQAVLA